MQSNYPIALGIQANVSSSGAYIQWVDRMLYVSQGALSFLRRRVQILSTRRPILVTVPN